MRKKKWGRGIQEDFLGQGGNSSQVCSWELGGQLEKPSLLLTVEFRNPFIPYMGQQSWALCLKGYCLGHGTVHPMPLFWPLRSSIWNNSHNWYPKESWRSWCAASFKCNTWVALHWWNHFGPTLGRRTLLGRQPLESLTPPFAEWFPLAKPTWLFGPVSMLGPEEFRNQY